MQKGQAVSLVEALQVSKVTSSGYQVDVLYPCKEEDPASLPHSPHIQSHHEKAISQTQIEGFLINTPLYHQQRFWKRRKDSNAHRCEKRVRGSRGCIRCGTWMGCWGRRGTLVKTVMTFEQSVESRPQECPGVGVLALTDVPGNERCQHGENGSE